MFNSFSNNTFQLYYFNYGTPNIQSSSPQFLLFVQVLNLEHNFLLVSYNYLSVLTLFCLESLRMDPFQISMTEIGEITEETSQMAH